MIDSRELSDLVERARANVEADKQDEAEPLYQQIFEETKNPVKPIERVAHGEACVFYARQAVAKERFGTAADWYRDALKVDPRAAEYRLELCAKALRPMGNLTIARQEAVRATLLEPDNPIAWRTRGWCEHELCHIEDCINCYDKQLELIPDDPHAMLDRATIALDTADYELAGALAEKVLETHRAGDGYHVLAMIEYRKGNHEKAIDLYDQTLELGCSTTATAHWNKSLALHSIGRYREGWAEHEWRKDETNTFGLSAPMRRFLLPMWTGEEKPPASIHVHAEAGMGDNLCQVRYLKMLVDKGYDVRYEANESMVSLVQRSFPDVTVVPKAIDYPGAIGLKPFDYHLPIGSAPYVFKTDIDSVPWFGPYLKSDLKLVRGYESKLPYSKNRRRRIGLCWSSGIRDTGIWITTYGKQKSMEFNLLWPIIHQSENVFVSLQVGPERKELNGCHGPVLDLLPVKPNWDDTAALIECLDLVITVDTAVAHLAGAMGKPVFLMMQKDGASWHFMSERSGASWNTCSPWYPTMRIFRQSKVGDWSDVVLKVKQALAHEVKGDGLTDDTIAIQKLMRL